jgi:hypothetical protein
MQHLCLQNIRNLIFINRTDKKCNKLMFLFSICNKYIQNSKINHSNMMILVRKQKQVHMLKKINVIKTF